MTFGKIYQIIINNKITKQKKMDYKKIIGLTIEEARESLKDHTVRIVKEDGKSLFVKFDARANRVNVAVVDDKITEIVNIG